MANKNKWSALGFGVTGFVVLFLFILPAYLSPDDIKRCGLSPDKNNIDSNCQPADAIIAISGGDTFARTDEAIKLYKNGWAPRIVFAGAAQDKKGPSNALVMKNHAEKLGIPSEDIIIEESSVNTEENAKNTADYIKSNKLQQIIIVTSAYHQRRAGLEFKRQIGNEVAIVNHPVPHDKQWAKQWYFTFSGWWLLLSELVKITSFYVGVK
jgi:uncharacterized SAM-binding protein YcdF (DUF218 family)